MFFLIAKFELKNLIIQPFKPVKDKNLLLIQYKNEKNT